MKKLSVMFSPLKITNHEIQRFKYEKLFRPVQNQAFPVACSPIELVPIQKVLVLLHLIKTEISPLR